MVVPLGTICVGMAASTGATFDPLGTEATVGGFVEQFGTTKVEVQLAKFPATSVARMVMR